MIKTCCQKQNKFTTEELIYKIVNVLVTVQLLETHRQEVIKFTFKMKAQRWPGFKY